MHLLTARIIAVRRLIKSIEAELVERPSGRGVGARRARLRDQSIFLDGLEEAANLALPPDEIQLLLDDLRK